MIAAIIPTIAIQIASRAIHIPMPSSDARDSFRLLKNNLKRFTLRKIKETREQVTFTAKNKQREITVILCCADLQNIAVLGNTLYLSVNSARLTWAYVAENTSL